MVIEQRVFLKCATHGASVYNSHLRGPLTPFVERLAVEMSLPVFTTCVCRSWDSFTQPSARGKRSDDCGTIGPTQKTIQATGTETTGTRVYDLRNGMK